MSEHENVDSVVTGRHQNQESDGESATRPGRCRLTVVSGPSGVGKSSVVDELRRLCPGIYFSVSMTTRQPRAGEIDGEHYRFVTPRDFESMVTAGGFLEHAEFAGNRYGTPRGPVDEALHRGQPAVLEIELQGARQVRARMPDAQLVMLLPPSWNDLVGRLSHRGTERDDVVRERLAEAERELAAAAEFDAHVVNADVQTAARELLGLMSGRVAVSDDTGEDR